MPTVLYISSLLTPLSVLRMGRGARDFTHCGEFLSSIILSAGLISHLEQKKIIKKHEET